MPRTKLLDRQLAASIREVNAGNTGTGLPLLYSAVVAQVGGSHYSKCSGRCPHCMGEIQHWDLFARMPYLEAQVARYVLRWHEKGQLEDLHKAQSFLTKLLAVVQMPDSALPTAVAALHVKRVARTVRDGSYGRVPGDKGFPYTPEERAMLVKPAKKRAKRR